MTEFRNLNNKRVCDVSADVCPKNKWLACDMDCSTCPFSRAGDARSLDVIDINEDGDEVAWVDKIPDDSPLLEEIVAEASEMTVLYARLTELMPEAITIGNLRLSGMSDRDIAKEIGIAKSTFPYFWRPLLTSEKLISGYHIASAIGKHSANDLY